MPTGLTYDAYKVQLAKLTVIDPADAEFLEGLVLKAGQEAIAKGKAQAAAEMKKLTGGLNIPGMG